MEQYDNRKQLPEINQKFIRSVMSTLTINKSTGRKPSPEKQKSLDKLKLFYDSTYAAYLPNKIKGSNISTLLDYAAIEMITNYNNHIQIHYSDIIKQFVNCMVDYKNIAKWIKYNKTADDLKLFNKIVFAIKSVSIYGDKYIDCKIDISEYSYIVDFIRNNVFSNIPDPLMVSQKEPLKLLPGLIKLNRILQKYNKKLFTCFPIKKSFVPGYITIDTTMLIHNFVFDQKSYFIKNQLSERDRLWNTYFKTNSNPFRKNGYEFNYQLSTDGVGCSILFIRNDLFKPLGKNWIPSMKKPHNYKSEKYVHDLSESERLKVLLTKLVGGDPGKHDLVHLADGSHRITINGNKKYNTLRYTQNNRAHDLKNKWYSNRLKNLEDLYFDDIRDNQQLNDKLSATNSRSCLISLFKEYIKIKLEVNQKVGNLYKEDLYRKLKWYKFINTQRSECNFINKFKETYGKTNTTVLMGDWSKTSIRGLPSTKGKGLRTMFRKYGIPVILVNEYNTSKKLFNGGNELDKFLKIKLHDKIRKCHGLLRSKSAIKGKSGPEYQIVNRDINGALNIRLKGECELLKKEVPNYLKPQTQNSSKVQIE